MKRRGFFGALLGVAAAPLAIKAAEALESVPQAPEPIMTINKRALGPPMYFADEYATAIVWHRAEASLDAEF